MPDRHKPQRLISISLICLLLSLAVACRRTPLPSVSSSPTPPLPSPTFSTPLATATHTPTLEATPAATDVATSAPPPTEPHTPTPTLAPRPTRPPRGGRVVEAGLEEVSTLNPLLADDAFSRAVGELSFDGLLRLHSQTAALLPGLTHDWEVSEDGRTFTFHLRPDVAWHDGRSLSAADVAFTLAVAADPEGPSPYRFDLAGIAEVTTPDGATVRVTFDEPGCDALYAVGRVPILPQHLLEGKDLAESAFNQRPVGTGPFVFSSWDAEEGLVLDANENYWAGRPYLDGWTYRVVPDAAALQDILRLGQAHLARLPADLGAAAWPDALDVLFYPADRWHFVALNNDHPLLGDATVRRALALALDRERLLEVVLGGQGTLMDAPWLVTHWALDDASLASLAYAPDQARQLLAEAGWRDADGDGLLEKEGERLRLSISTSLGNPVREQIAILTQQYWHAVGISAQVEVLPWGIFLDDLFGHSFDTAVFDWPLEPAPDQIWLWAASENEPGIGFNFVSFANPQADVLLDRARMTSDCDPASRAAAYRNLAQLLATEQPYVFLFAPHRRLAVAKVLLGPQPGPYGGLYWNVPEWHLAESEIQ